jgi:hypothetical protein
MGLREEIAKVRMARSRLEITRAKLKQLDEDQMRLERSLGKAQPEEAEPERSSKPVKRRRLNLD